MNRAWHGRRGDGSRGKDISEVPEHPPARRPLELVERLPAGSESESAGKEDTLAQFYRQGGFRTCTPENIDAGDPQRERPVRFR